MPKKGYKATPEHRKNLSDAQKRIGNRPPSALGLKRSLETRKNISKSKIGIKRILTNEWKNNISNSLKGRKLSIELRKKFSEVKMGEKNPRWKGGKMSESKMIRQRIEYRLWREAIFARDNWTCQKYKIRGGKLHPHHIKNFAQFIDLRFAIDNGITLSEKAHKEFHKKYGIENNNLEQIKEFCNL